MAGTIGVTGAQVLARFGLSTNDVSTANLESVVFILAADSEAVLELAEDGKTYAGLSSDEKNVAADIVLTLTGLRLLDHPGLAERVRFGGVEIGRGSVNDRRKAMLQHVASLWARLGVIAGTAGRVTSLGYTAAEDVADDTDDYARVSTDPIERLSDFRRGETY